MNKARCCVRIALLVVCGKAWNRHPQGWLLLRRYCVKPPDRALRGNVEEGMPVSLTDGQQEQRECIVSAAPLLSSGHSSGHCNNRIFWMEQSSSRQEP